MAPPSYWRTSICHKRLQLSSVVLWTVIIVSCLCQVCDAQNSSSVTQTILAHPSMFGSPWTGAVTAAVLKTTIDLCDESVEPSSTTENIFITSLSVNELNDQYEIAIFYDDPSSEEEKCQYSQMAETAERLYPSAKYLLVSKDIFSAMTKGDDEPDTILSLASIQRDDAIAINNMFRNNTGVSISEGVILLRIDAYSRAYIDTCNCTEDETVAERKRMWTITLRVSSVLSILGSNYIILSLIGTGARRKKNLQLLFNRLLISICCFDIISSFAIFWGAWAEPSQPPGDFEKFYSQAKWDMDNPGANGNDTTCNVQGALLIVGILGSAFFTAFLTIQTLLIVRYGWHENKMQRVQVFFFSVGISFPLISASIAVALRVISVGKIGFCWIASSPKPCSSYRLGPLFEEYCGETLNISPDRRTLYTFLFVSGWASLTFFIIIFSMLSLFLFVRNQENRASRWTLTSQTGRQQKLVLARTFMYISVYVVIWIPSVISIRMDSIVSETIVTYLFPLQGFFNAIIYTGIFEKYFLPRQSTTRETTTAQFTNSVEISQRQSRESNSASNSFRE